MSVFITQIVLTLYDCVTGNIACKLAAAYMYLWWKRLAKWGEERWEMASRGRAAVVAKARGHQLCSLHYLAMLASIRVQAVRWN